jgi:hypothetical protein
MNDVTGAGIRNVLDDFFLVVGLVSHLRPVHALSFSAGLPVLDQILGRGLVLRPGIV